MVHARERAQDITPPFPPESGCDTLPVVLHPVRGGGIEFQGLTRPCSIDLSVSPQTKAEPVVGRKNLVFRAAFRKKAQYRDAPSYAEHPVFTGLG